MNRLMDLAHEPIDRSSIRNRHTQTAQNTFDLYVQHIRPFLHHSFGNRQEERRQNDDEVASQHDIPDRNIAVVVDNHSHNIRSSRRAVACNHGSQT